jgi:glycosyltransferase involved in cell wall biosynthesis
MIRPDESIEDLSERLEVPYPNPRPYTDVTAGMVLWNEAHRLPRLLEILQPAFEHIVLVVQDSIDETLAIAQAAARDTDKVLLDAHRGTGDASMPKLLAHIDTDWSFILAGDETPEEELLASLWTAGRWAEERDADGLWIDFLSTVDGVPAAIESAHLRMFHTALPWPNTMHSRVTPKRDGLWPFGRIHHDRSLDEMIIDYLRYLEASGSDSGWIAHNKLMIREACSGVAAVKGWPYVESFPWWPEAKRKAFS